MADTFVWTGDGGNQYWFTAGNWFDLTTGTTATSAPGAGATADFNASASDVSGGADVAAVNIAPGAQVSFGPLPGGATFNFGTLAVGAGVTLTLLGGTDMTVTTANLAAGAGLDISRAWWVGVSTEDPNAQQDAATTSATGAYPGPVSAIIDTLTLAQGATVTLGDRNLGVGVLYNANSGTGNGFDPAAGISGTGQLVDPARSEVAMAASIPAIDFGTVALGTTVTKTFTVENLEGDAAPFPLVGALQTDVNGASITDPDLSGSGVTAQDFSVPGRGGTDTFAVTLTAQHAGALQGQAINLAYEFDGTVFDQNVLLPITGDVVGEPPGDAACFVAGTRIATPAGELSVESLRPGDRVRTAAGRAAPVRWVGLRTLAVAAPMRIAAGAIAPGVPLRDLLLSPDHAVCLDGAVIPAHLLRNGATVRAEPGTRHVTYVHVELDRHDTLLAEGLASESYLDTGNRVQFDRSFGARSGSEAGGGDRLAATLASYAAEGCAELLLGGERVRRAHGQLLARAQALGWRLAAEAAPLLVVGGRTLAPLREADGTLAFALPAGTAAVTLLSRSFVPNQIDPARPDGRRLGIAVAVWLDGAAPPEAAFGSGWYPPDAGCDWRWSDGAARLHLAAAARPVRLSLRVMAAGARYWRAPPPSRRAAA